MEPAENLLIVSDLHLSEGWKAEEGGYARSEDFFYDAQFFAFLRHHQALRPAPRYQDKPWLLILNGDTFDFIQVTTLPNEGEELRRVTGVSQYKWLSSHRQKYGLGTSPAESVWKVQQMAQGHPQFFAALGWFVAQGNRVLFIKGNHDPELHWPEVQQALRDVVADAYAAYRQHHAALPELVREQLDVALAFEPWFYYDRERGLYIEHGSQYEPTNAFRNMLNPVLPHKPQLLELPRGLLMSRYVYNLLEETHPYADNVRPTTRAIVWMFRENALYGLAVLLRRFADLFWAWRELRRKQAELDQVDIPNPTPLESYNGLPAALIAEIVGVAQERSSFSWEVWGKLILEQLSIGLLSLLGFVAGVVSLYSFVVWGSVEGGLLYLFLSFVLLNGSSIWASIVNGDEHLDYMPEVACHLAHCFRQLDVPLRALILGHTHIPKQRYVCVSDTQTCTPDVAAADCDVAQRINVVNTGTWISVASRDPWGWETHLVFCRIASGAALTDPPEFLEWSPGLDDAHFPLLHWAGKRTLGL